MRTIVYVYWSGSYYLSKLIVFSCRFFSVVQRPHFKLGVVGYINPDKKEIIRERVIKEVLNKVDPVLDAVEVGQLQSEDEADPFMHMHMRDGILVEAQGGSQKEVEGTYASWDKDLVKSKISISCDHFPLQQRSAWLYNFRKYNTPLPSSAAVERLFSFGSDILRPKRSSLTADNFETLVFVKGNMHLFK